MTMTQTIYASRPFVFDEPTFRQILLSAERNNARDDITGSLICREDIYLQLLEGPDDKVAAALARIGRDPRHVNLKVLVSRQAETRLFGAWAMRHDPARSWMWTQADIRDGALDKATPEQVVGVFERLSVEEPVAGHDEAGSAEWSAPAAGCTHKS